MIELKDEINIAYAAETMKKIRFALVAILTLISSHQPLIAETETPQEIAGDLGARLQGYFGQLPVQANELVRIDEVTVEDTKVVVHFTFTHPAQDQFKTSVAPVQEGAADVFCADELTVETLNRGVSLEARFQPIDKSQTVAALIDAEACN